MLTVKHIFIHEKQACSINLVWTLVAELWTTISSVEECCQENSTNFSQNYKKQFSLLSAEAQLTLFLGVGQNVI